MYVNRGLAQRFFRDLINSMKARPPYLLLHVHDAEGQRASLAG
jgi:hypothetical protein